MLPHALQRVFRAFFRDLDLERKSGLTALLWGAWVIAFGTFSSGPAYYYLIASASWLTGPVHAEWLWGGLTVAAGCAQLVGVFSDRADGRVRLRMGAALFSCTLWVSLGVAFTLTNPVSTAPVVYGLFALANAALYYQIGTGQRGRHGRFTHPPPAGWQRPTTTAGKGEE